MMKSFERVASVGDRQNEREGGFTLIELLTVVIVMGVLVAIAIPMYLHFSTNAENRSIQSDVHNAINAVNACAADNGGKVAGGTVAATTGSIYMTCKADGSGVAYATKPVSGADQTINLSPNVSMAYTPSTDKSSFVLVATYSDSTHATVKYDSTTGKTTVT
jgi:type IV pilus assembly protein PilA